ncbi:ribosomal RNA small subunit methyltransferase I [Candidatus Rickettsia kotlanii]|nr:ribosomal RNA small subunit methyltransferase I [Candidatus Rickettsia kotlanii]BDU61042.1 ribosomal RNA small subunit methyltransferase I [Candidatus Rickettsia kotlanii]
MIRYLSKPGLYIVSTPIGNFEDITLRAISTLKNSDIILCEDTRISQKLLAKHDIHTKLQIYNDHSDEKDRENIISLIKSGNIISLISDAGTPLISDPGYKLVRDICNLNYHIDVVPGVSAPVTALTLSALPTDRFLFHGFLPKTIESKKKIFSELVNLKATLIFFETAPRLINTLSVAKEILGNRDICVARELTKLYQEIKTGDIDEIIAFYQNNILKGEIVLLISGNIQEQNQQKNLENFIELCLSKNLSSKTTTELVYDKFKDVYSKKEIYRLVNKQKI